MRAFYSDHFVLPLPEGHRFPMAKYSGLRARIIAERIIDPADLHEAPAASWEELRLVHTAEYVDAIATGTVGRDIQRRIGFPWSPAMVERSRRSVGATIAAARAARQDGVSANLAGGTHHAFSDRGEGYCVFNDVAVAARVLQRDRLARRIAIVDLDVHQGNGTAAIFRDDPTVFTLSLHAARNFPARKECGDLDIELPDGCGDDAYLGALDVALAEVWRRHGDTPPRLAFYVAGADPHEHDRLGRLKLSFAGLAERDRRVFDALRRRRIPTAVSMAGGYGRTLDSTVAVHRRTLAEALHSWRLWHGQDAS